MLLLIVLAVYCLLYIRGRSAISPWCGKTVYLNITVLNVSGGFVKYGREEGKKEGQKVGKKKGRKGGRVFQTIDALLKNGLNC